MKGFERLKLALDETRMLVLGAQVLLGFQLGGAFQDGFDELSALSKSLHAVSLMLMAVVVALLIAPAIQHRVANGRASASRPRAVGGFMLAALVPLALSLSISLFVAIDRVGGLALALLVGTAAAVAAFWLWFGMELRAMRWKGLGIVQPENEHVTLAQKIDQMLTEARVILPGAQALLGFQLTVVLTQAFERLPAGSKAVHVVALAAVTLCTIVLIAPAAYHRLVYAGEASRELYQLGGRFLMLAALALAVGLAADIYVVIAKIAQSATVGVAAAAVAFAVLIGLWHVAPMIQRSTHLPRG